MKKLFGVVCVLIAMGVACYFYFGGSVNPASIKKQLAQEAQDAVLNNAAPEEIAALALKAIQLTQGEQGVELWRLKADWGNMRRKDNVMELEKPSFTYYMPPDNKVVTIVANKGEIEQEQQIIRFIDSVVITYEGRTLHAPEVVYFGKPREIICPQGGLVQGQGYEGSAARNIVWYMKNQVIEAVGDIAVLFDNDLFTPQPDNPETPPAEDLPSAEDMQG
jgi:Uncharacterized protein conserved in bacteria